MVEFRTKYNPGDFSDNEFYEPGTSLTEPGQAESMQDLVARMSKAELVQRLAKKNQIVGDATKSSDITICASSASAISVFSVSTSSKSESDMSASI